ncbi:hypothetical protein FC83_GL002607 [Agrilactobacillus composti DSM 18527 = JCM 14202]|uniref:Surface layer protein A domain-containing protein n=1 Tax=Agrilactobacillus composti DSM 18527 = JCM 14202 TaxID=1423734 RepID=X0PU50_9LACO|nr:hypothetical protein [Agrilactobacillus composti]KRM36732.1 hypothetical protein FC83_GL002607 [Agrilactobacillus composti DSM 18527 = JCM 14202]GAF41587.1 hypothetical protein JCM14202_3537 [Agrilactobacillus composti DSM 18527 = JCM 14202]
MKHKRLALFLTGLVLTGAVGLNTSDVAEAKLTTEETLYSQNNHIDNPDLETENPGIVRAWEFPQVDTYYALASNVTVTGPFGGNLFNGNDNNKTYNRVLPKGSVWQAFGVTHRGDGYYYDLGGNQWLEAKQAKLAVVTLNDAYLNVIISQNLANAHVHLLALNGGWIWNGYWGNQYVEIGQYHTYGFGIRETFYVVYPDGSTYNIGQ